MGIPAKIYDVYEKLSDDNYSQDDIKEIIEARNRINNGDGLSFSSMG